MRKKTNYMNMLELDNAEKGWTFFTTDSLNIAKLTESVGFRYKQTGNDYIHAGTLIFLSSDRKITRYLNGTRFLPFEFKMAVIETSKGKSGPTLNKVLQYCYSYNPEGQGYVLNITRVAGVIISFILLIIFVSLLLRSYVNKRKEKQT
jgi:protein SCO1/2